MVTNSIYVSLKKGSKTKCQLYNVLGRNAPSLCIACGEQNICHIHTNVARPGVYDNFALSLTVCMCVYELQCGDSTH